MENDERKKRVAEAMQRFIDAQAAVGIHWTPLRWKCPCKYRMRIMCNTKNDGKAQLDEL